MGAAAFTETIMFKGQKNGRPIHLGMTVSDVANEYAIAPDGNGFVQLPSDQNYLLSDIIVVTGGTDTNFQEIFANGTSTGVKCSNKSNLNTANFRQFATNPIGFNAGTLLRFKQLA